MFVREKKTPLSNKTAIQLVEAVREGNKIKQKILRHFGFAYNSEEIDALKNLALRYKLELENKSQPILFETGTLMQIITQASKKGDDDTALHVNLKNIVEEKRLKIGIHQVYGNLFNQIGFDKVVHNPLRKKASVRLMRDIVMARINRPESKMSSVNTLSDEYGIDVNVNAVYRMMDLIDDKAISKIQQTCYENTFGLLGETIDIIFYDCTTLYFESFTEDELKENGYSKDGKFNQSQVILALMVSKHGLPVGYEVFPGSTFEGHTLSNALERLHAQYKIDKIIFVADAAMLSEDNIKMLEKREQPFIVGARIKNLSKVITDKILDTSKYNNLYEVSEQQAPVTYQDLTIKEDDLRLIVTHSPNRAAKDKHDREKAIEQVKKRLAKSNDPKSLLNNYGYKKYITISGETEISINEEKIKQAEKWDGLHGIITNIKDTYAKDLLSHYKGLWQVEETFRISKHDLRMRPVFHWTPRRIKAHIAICFMALTCIRTLEYKVRLQYKKLSPEAIRKTITVLEMSILKDTTTGKRYTLPSQASQDAKKIYQILNLKWRQTPFLIK